VRILLDYRPALRQRTGVGEYVHELAKAAASSDAFRDDELVLFHATPVESLQSTVQRFKFLTGDCGLKTVDWLILIFAFKWEKSKSV